MCKESSSREEERILDTWMDSSISAYFIQKYSMNKSINSIQELFKGKEFICDLRPSGKEIIRTWLHYSMLRGHLLFKKPMFQHIWISGHVMEKKGEKMSKSKGNIIEPEPIIEKYGADALRLFGASETKLGSDMKFSEEKLRGMSKFLTKLYNISKFISSFENPLNQDFDLNQLANIDKWIINQLHKIFEQRRIKDIINTIFQYQQIYLGILPKKFFQVITWS